MQSVKRGYYYGVLSAAIALAITGCGSDSNNSSGTPSVSTPKAPKNIIVMINDGASYGTWDMAAYWEAGVKANELDIFKDMNVRLGMTTYPLNTDKSPSYNDISTVGYDAAMAWDNSHGESLKQDGYESTIAGYKYLRRAYTDSAAAGTAMATGTKTYNQAIGYSNMNEPLTNITQIAHARNKATGVVTSVQVSHATPSAFSAHSPSRYDMVALAKDQLTNGYVDLLIGTGHPEYDNNGIRVAGMSEAECAAVSCNWWDVQNPESTIGASEWQALKAGSLTRSGAALPNYLITSKAEFAALAAGDLPADLAAGQPLVGIPEVRSTLQQGRNKAAVGSDGTQPSGIKLIQGVPDLATLSTGALNYLASRNKDGLFLMIEGGATDWSAHANATGTLIEEAYDFHQAVRAVKQWVETHSSWDETLLIVTTDHGNALPLHPDSAFQAFAPMNNAGAGNVPMDGVDVRYWSTQHTNELARLWAKGNGTDAFAEVIKGADYDFAKIVGHNDTGYYVDNTDIFNVAKRLLTLQAE